MFKARLTFRADFECGKSAWYSHEFDIPFVPFDGLQLCVGSYHCEVEFFQWQTKDGGYFHLHATNDKYEDSDFTFSDFNEWVIKNGFKVKEIDGHRKAVAQVS